MNLYFTTRAAYFAAAVIALGYFATFLYQRALNIPYHDDILDALQFVLNFTSAQGVKESFDLLFLQHNDHRTASSRLAYYLLYRFEGEVNFRSLNFLANLALPIIALTLTLGVRKRADVALVFLVGILVLCNPRAYNQIFWATSSFAFFYVYAYALLTLYVLRNNNAVNLPLGIVFALASTFSLASGKMVWIAGFVLLAWQVWVQRMRSPWHVLIWAVVAIAVLLFYSHDTPSPNTVSRLAEQFSQFPRHHLAYALGILGSVFCFESLPAALAIGVLSCSVLAFIVFQDARENRLGWLHAYALFVVLSALALALGRAHYSYLSYVMEGRYSFPSANFQLCVFVLACNRGLLKFRWLQPAIAVAAVLISIALYREYTAKTEANLNARIADFNRGNYRIFGMPHAYTRGIVQQSISLGLYVPPPKFEKPKRRRKEK